MGRTTLPATMHTVAFVHISKYKRGQKDLLTANRQSECNVADFRKNKNQDVLDENADRFAGLGVSLPKNFNNPIIIHNTTSNGI